MLIKNVNRNVKDVFFGQGWSDWARFERHNNQWSVIRGNAPFAVQRAFRAKVK